MITVTMSHQKARMSAFNDTVIEITGHAMNAPYGHDIVCAAVSVLYSAVANHITSSRVDDLDGKVTMVINSLDAGNQRLIETFTDTIQELSLQYPDNVQLIDGD